MAGISFLYLDVGYVDLAGHEFGEEGISKCCKLFALFTIAKNLIEDCFAIVVKRQDPIEWWNENWLCFDKTREIEVFNASGSVLI